MNDRSSWVKLGVTICILSISHVLAEISNDALISPPDAGDQPA
jgi:hypothetical protein